MSISPEFSILAWHRIGAATCPLDGLLHRPDLPHPIAGDELLCLGEWTVNDARVGLTLRLIAGLSTAEIARAFLTTEATMSQRIVRAKRTLSEAKVPFEVPIGDDLRARVPPTLEVVYLIFNEGYAATAGDDWLRSELCEEAMRLGRILVELVPDDAEVHGLLALMELQASRARARIGPRGVPVIITRGLAALERAQALEHPLGPYTIQAAVAGCHARACTPEEGPTR